MKLIKIEDLVDELLVTVPSCPSVLAEQALLTTIREWYQETHSWKEELQGITCFSDVDTYAMRREACSMILTILSAEIKGQEQPVEFLLPDRVRLIKNANDNDTLKITVALSLHANANAVLCDHANRYLIKWVDGALWYLLAMPNQQWSDRDQAEYRRIMFRNSITQERNEQLSGRLYGSQRVRSRLIL